MDIRYFIPLTSTTDLQPLTPDPLQSTHDFKTTFALNMKYF